MDQALKSVEKWHENTTLRKKMMAPLLPIIIQCSGTGKSRLLHCVRHLDTREKHTRTILLVANTEDCSVNEGSYDKIYRVEEKLSRDEQRNKMRKMIQEVCRSCESESCTLLFDEAQHLTSALYAGLREKGNSSYMRNMGKINTASSQLL